MNLASIYWTRPLLAILTFMLVVPVIPAHAMIWAESYDSMIDRADLIFVGTLSETRTYKLKEVIYADNPEKAQEVEGLYTDHVFRIDRVLKGNYTEPGIAISEFGGIDGGHIRGSLQMLYFLFIGKQYLILAVHSAITPSKWVSASYGLGVLEISVKDGKSYLQSVSNTEGIEMKGDSSSKIEQEISIEEFIIKIEGASK